MWIYNDDNRNILARVCKGRYTMAINGWYAGGFSAPDDTAALGIFKRILSEEGGAW